MKYQIIAYICTLSLVLLSLPNAWSQTKPEQPLESFNSRLTFDGVEFEKNVSLIITKKSRYMRLNIEGEIKGGNASATLYSKNGRKVCGLGLKAKDGHYAKGTMGEELEVRDGIYILKIRNDSGQGYLHIDFSQH